MNDKLDVEWDYVIESKSGLFDLDLKSTWEYRSLIWLMVRRDFVAFYKQTILGPIWFFIQPIFITITYVLVFGKLAKISTESVPPPLFYLAGITAWSYFSETLLKVSGVFRDNASIFGKVYFPRLIIPISIIFSNLIKFFVQLTLLFLFMIYYSFQGYHFQMSWMMLLFPFLIVLLALQSMGLGMILSGLTTKYRDLSLLLGFGIQLLMYATPVVYPMSILTPKMKFYLSLNPLSFIIEGFRKCLYGTGEFNIMYFFISTFFTIIILFFGIIIFNKVQKNFIDTI
jgi:lipopolysaccharide transport system permease protein